MSLDDEDGALSVARRTTAPLAAACVILSIVCLLLSGFILYIFCSKKYKLNWYERNLLEASKNQVGFEPPLSCHFYFMSCHVVSLLFHFASYHSKSWCIMSFYPSINVMSFRTTSCHIKLVHVRVDYFHLFPLGFGC